MAQAGDLGDVTMSESLENFASILGGVMTAPWLKGGAACVAMGCETLGLPLDLVWVLVGLFVGDFALGIVIAVKERQFSLKKFARGFAKIPVYTLVLVIAWLCQFVMQTVLAEAVPVPLWACAYLAMHEALSVLSKCEALDLPVPALIKRILEKVNTAAERHAEKVLDAVTPEDKSKEDK